MNEEEVRKFKDKIIKCDITIHIQQLGTQWKASEQEDEETLLAAKRQAQLNNEKDQNEQTDDEKLIVSEEKLGEILAMLLEEADFLINDRIREELCD
jgi:dynein regulatory complex protein 1